MTHDEYEQRKGRLEEELRAGVELLETAHRHQLRALQLVWAATGGDGVEIPPPVVTATAATSPAAPGPPALPAVSPQPARRGAWGLYNDVHAALAEVPEVFDRNDVCRILGYEPNRGSLYRTFLELKQDAFLLVEEHGTGKSPTRYRKTGLTGAAAGE